MPDRPLRNAISKRMPWHLFVLGMVLVLWNGMGVAFAIGAQIGALPEGTDPDAIAYFAARPLWLMLLTDAASLAGLAGAVALLVQSRFAVALFVAQLVLLLVTKPAELILDRELVRNPELAIAGTVVLVAVVLAQIAYARWLARSGMLG